jgi:uncharacterized protein YbcI
MLESWKPPMRGNFADDSILTRADRMSMVSVRRRAAHDMLCRLAGRNHRNDGVFASPPVSASDASEVRMKSQGEIEAAICDGITRFEQEYMGRGPKHIHAHLVGDLLVVRLQGVLTAAEQHLVQTLPPEKGRDLLKQVRTQLIETARPVLEALVRESTGVDVVSLHHDISVVTGEEIVLFTLAEAPRYREARKK